MKTLSVGIVGNPNCGKSTLFNALTGARQKVGNWPGVTVECKTGQFSFRGKLTEIVDLPGVYHLFNLPDTFSVDERIACDYILSRNYDLIINIVDAIHLERHLYLTTQLLAMRLPMIVAVNMLDIAKRRDININLQSLSKQLGCPVVAITANKGEGIPELKRIITSYDYQKNYRQHGLTYPPIIQQALSQIANRISNENPSYASSSEWLALQLLQNDSLANQKVPLSIQDQAADFRLVIEHELKEEIDIIFADIFYSFAHRVTLDTVKQTKQKITVTERIDKIVLNKFLGIPIFLIMMYAMFLFAINLGGAFQDFFDIGSETIFVQGTTQLLQLLHAPSWLIAILAAGLGKGINTTVSFIPVIAGMFFFLSLLESSGYMARAAFVVDRLMRAVGLPGKSFVPMIVGFGCNVPAILAARTLENPRDRALTILMSPFMSCGARLAIFAVFTAAFFPSGGQNIVFSLYCIGILMAILTGFILRKTVLKSELTPLVLELPSYHMPSLLVLCRQTWHRLKDFIFRAGKLIVPVCMLIGMLNAINIDGTLNRNESNSNSILSSVGRVMTPLFSPMGIQQDNWPATVGLVTGVLAKEVVVATLNTLYMQELPSSHYKAEEKPSFLQGIHDAILSVPVNLIALKDSFTNPIAASTPDHILNHSVYGLMYERFGGQTGAFAYLLFILLYFPCVSATAVMAKELSKRWTLFSVLWSTGIAYGVATLFYQLMTFSLHRYTSIAWILTIVGIFCMTLMLLGRRATERSFEESTTATLQTSN